jgi:myosin heavy subunit
LLKRYEAVAIRKIGFPFRLPHKQFLSRFNCILMQDDRSWLPLKGTTVQEKILSLIGQAAADISGVVVGRTMCLYRASEHRLLMLMRHLALERLVPDCQRVVRGYFAREMKRRLLRANAELQKALDVGNDYVLLEDAIASSTEIIGSFAALFRFQPPLLDAVIALMRKVSVGWASAAELVQRVSE